MPQSSVSWHGSEGFHHEVSQTWSLDPPARAFFNTLFNMSTYNYAPGALHLDIHPNYMYMSATQVADLVSAIIRTADVEDVKCEEVSSQTESFTQLFKYIHYRITDDKEKLQVHKMICNIVRIPKMQQVCDALLELMKQEMILSTIDQCAMLNELHRLGLPSDQKGFSDKNFYSFYRTK